jgi:hypothetical protein
MDLSKLSDDDLAALQSGDLKKVSDDGLNYLQSQQSQQSAGKDNTEPVSPEDADSAVGAAGAGASEAMLNIPTYIAAAGDVAKNALAGNNTAKSWLDYKRQRQAVNKAQAEAHPYAHLGGALAGTLATSALAPELGIAEGIGATSALGKVGAAGLEAAVPGAVFGAAGSDANPLTDTKQFAKDVASGAGMGAITGGALNAAGQAGSAALSKAGEMVGENDFAQKAKQLFGLGYDKNVNLSTSSGKDIAKMMIEKEIPNDIVNQWMTVDEANGKAVGAAIQGAMDKGTNINITSDLLTSVKNLQQRFASNPQLEDLMDPKSRQVMDLIFKKADTDLTPIEAKALRDSLYDMSSKLSGIGGEVAPAIQRQGMNLGSAINDQLKAQIPEYNTAASKFSEFRSLIPETVLEPGTPLDKRTAFLGDLKNKQSDLLSATRGMMKEAQMPGASESARTGLTELGQNMDQLKITNPDVYNKLGGDSAFQNLKDKANLVAGIKQAYGDMPHEGAKRAILGQLIGSGEGMALNVANKLGRAAKVAGQSGPVTLGTKLFSSGNDQLMNLANKMQSSPATKMLGDSLETALGNKTDTLKNAVLFRMLQDPAYRGMLKEIGYDDGMGENKQ